MDFWSICIPLFFMGVGMPMYYIPITGLAMGSVEEHEMASAAGLMNFVRTIAGAFATSLVTTFWQDGRYIVHDQLSSIVDPTVEAKVDGVPVMECAYGKFNGQYTLRVERMLATGASDIPTGEQHV